MATICKLCARKLKTNLSKASWYQTLPGLLRQLSSDSSGLHSNMSAWQVHQYGGSEELTLSNTCRLPAIQHPNDILVQVHAASVNPIDVYMRNGYGHVAINLLRRQCGNIKTGSEFPLILGRDFSGVVLETGKNVKTIKYGDQVWGALGAHRQGSHAQYTVASEKEVSKKPKSLSHVEAATIPYVAATAWMALCTVGRLTEENTCGKRIFIQCGSGGIGSFAIQLMKAWGAYVTTTCSTDAVDSVRELGADFVIDYKTQDVLHELKCVEKFDFILDALGTDECDYMDFLRPWDNAMYVSIKTPLLQNTDDLGLACGVLKTVTNLSFNVLQGFRGGKNYRLALFMPNGKALEKVALLVDQGQIQPVVDKVFSFEEVPDAFEKVAEGHARGKTAIQIIEQEK